MSAERKTGFSIYNPAVLVEHLEFYEEFLSQLGSVSPICNQGRSAAVEIAEDRSEEEPILDLITKVEDFASELLNLTKNLFAQYYQKKEEFFASIYGMTAYNKINLIDRNLLERTCDVRWWAMETSFWTCISRFEAFSESGYSLIEEIKGSAAGNSSFVNIITERIETFISAIRTKEEGNKALQFVEDEWSRAPSEVKGPSTEAAYRTFLTQAEEVRRLIDHACLRLEDIRGSYTLYRDLVIVSRSGFVLANANPACRRTVLQLKVDDEYWFVEAMNTRDGNQSIAQDIRESKLEDQPSLIFSTAVRAEGRVNETPIGALGVCFDFQGECQFILDEYLPKDPSGVIADGWYSFLSNRQHRVISSTDDVANPVGTIAQIPRSHRECPNQTLQSVRVVLHIDAYQL